MVESILCVLWPLLTALAAITFFPRVASSYTAVFSKNMLKIELKFDLKNTHLTNHICKLFDFKFLQLIFFYIQNNDSKYKM